MKGSFRVRNQVKASTDCQSKYAVSYYNGKQQDQQYKSNKWQKTKENAPSQTDRAHILRWRVSWRGVKVYQKGSNRPANPFRKGLDYLGVAFCAITQNGAF